MLLRYVVAAAGWVFTFEELKRLAGLQRNMTNDEFAKQIANVNRRLLALNFEFQNEEHDIIQFALFAGFVTSPTKTHTHRIGELALLVPA